VTVDYHRTTFDFAPRKSPNYPIRNGPSRINASGDDPFFVLKLRKRSREAEK
jgi:hypothetical protein